jgi:small subunit ribosomal protein S14
VARTSIMAKYRRTPKFKVRVHNRCPICGRPRGYMRRFDMCRICFRKLASIGKLPGVTKSSW